MERLLRFIFDELQRREGNGRVLQYSKYFVTIFSTAQAACHQGKHRLLYTVVVILALVAPNQNETDLPPADRASWVTKFYTQQARLNPPLVPRRRHSTCCADVVGKATLIGRACIQRTVSGQRLYWPRWLARLVTLNVDRRSKISSKLTQDPEGPIANTDF